MAGRSFLFRQATVRRVVVPCGLLVISLIATTLFVLGIVYWVKGAGLGNASMVRMGKIMFGCSFIPNALIIIGSVGACCVKACN